MRSIHLAWRSSLSLTHVSHAAVVDLFLDVAVALGTPQTSSDAYEAEAPALVKSLLLVRFRLSSSSDAELTCSDPQRIPIAKDTDAQDSSLALSAASNAASLAVAELAAVANVFGLGDQVSWLRATSRGSR